MSEAKHILSYASSAGTSDVHSTEFSMTFAAPPFWGEVIPNYLALAVCSVVFVLLIVLAVNEGSHSENAVGAMVFLIAATIAFAGSRIPPLARAHQFRNEVVRFDVRGETLFIHAPLQWAAESQKIDVSDVRSCKARLEGQSLGLVKIYRILIDIGWFNKITVRVAVEDRSVIERAVADLQRACELAKKAINSA